jgi:hypothetical protein
MKRLVLVLAILVLLVAPSGAAAARGFTGSWESIDTDGSWQQFLINGGPDVYEARMVDHYARTCGVGLGRPMKAVFTMTAEGNTLTGMAALYCMKPRELWTNAQLTMVYDPATDTMTDQFGMIWHRATAGSKPL